VVRGWPGSQFPFSVIVRSRALWIDAIRRHQEHATVRCPTTARPVVASAGQQAPVRANATAVTPLVWPVRGGSLVAPAARSCSACWPYRGC
jgi:hypothetical protein